MNSCNFTGRLTRDPEVRTVGDSGMKVSRFGLAVNRRFRKENQPTADFINCVAFGKTADVIEKFFHKGMKADISARVQTGSYTKDDGSKVYTTDFVVDQIEFGESKNAAASTNTSSEFMNIPEGIDENLPFN